VAILFLILLPARLLADPRPFTFVNDAYPAGKGTVEYEQWVTYQAHTAEDHSFQRIAFVNELELGLTDNIDLDLYLGNFSYEDSISRTGLTYDSSAAELYYYFTSPVTDPLGIAMTLEVTVEPRAVEVETALILQKDVGPWIFAYNLALETECVGVFSSEQNDTEGAIGQAFGASYSLTPQWRVGGELTIASEFENWNTYQDTAVYLGPNLSYTGGKIGSSNVGWWTTLTAMGQLTDVDDEPDLQVRLVAGLEF
jgi:hypothetical protein